MFKNGYYFRSRLNKFHLYGHMEAYPMHQNAIHYSGIIFFSVYGCSLVICRIVLDYLILVNSQFFQI